MSWLAGEAEPDRSDADTEGLGSDQSEAVATILGADTNGVLVIGPAGSGKTEMLGRVARGGRPRPGTRGRSHRRRRRELG